MITPTFLLHIYETTQLKLYKILIQEQLIVIIEASVVQYLEYHHRALNSVILHFIITFGVDKCFFWIWYGFRGIRFNINIINCIMTWFFNNNWYNRTVSFLGWMPFIEVVDLKLTAVGVLVHYVGGSCSSPPWTALNWLFFSKDTWRKWFFTSGYARLVLVSWPSTTLRNNPFTLPGIE